MILNVWAVISVILLAALWKTATDYRDAFYKEQQEHMNACKEIGELTGRCEAAEKESSEYDDLADVMLSALNLGYEIKHLGGEYHFLLPGVFDGRRCIVTDKEIDDRANYHLIRDMLVTTWSRPKGKRIEHDIRIHNSWLE